jgi:hypothetical protein
MPTNDAAVPRSVGIENLRSPRTLKHEITPLSRHHFSINLEFEAAGELEVGPAFFQPTIETLPCRIITVKRRAGADHAFRRAVTAFDLQRNTTTT